MKLENKNCDVKRRRAALEIRGGERLIGGVEVDLLRSNNNDINIRFCHKDILHNLLGTRGRKGYKGICTSIYIQGQHSLIINKSGVVR